MNDSPRKMDWNDFADRLALELPNLAAGTFVIISELGSDDRGRYVQFVQEHDKVIVEVVANCFLENAERASVAGEQAICAAGWSRPQDSNTDNWSYWLSWPAYSQDYQKLAEMVVKALRDGYGIESPASWRYRAWNNVHGNRIVELKRLGLATF